MTFLRYGRASAVAVVGMLALAACGSDNNSSSSSSAGTGGSSSGAAASGGASSAAGGAAAACAKGTVNAEGSSAQANAMSAWIKAYQGQCSGVTINYNPTGSGAGVTAFNAGREPFVGSDSALKPEEKTAADKRCSGGPAIDLPMVVGPIAVAYNVKGVDGLQLSAATVAKIFSGKITKWDDAAIKADNPSAQLPSTPIQPIHRSDSSGTTDNFTKWLTAAAKSDWTFDHDKVWKAPGGQGAAKSSGVASAIAAGDGTIGYVEYSFVQSASLKAAKIANDGKNFVELSAANASKAVEGAKPADGATGNDLALSLDYATTDPSAYPIVLVTYEITCEKGLKADEASFVKSFLGYTSGAGQQLLTPDLGYAPLPASLQTKVAAAVAAIS
ncbi:phosphate ABC transporter substrate-binding protein PstS [Motilibacter rhizosphaerae]|uniref:phosphate ABC transporter substrate-binding protein PstS n=1 Tax=Motilibacter rhizosphaerae TaxID=598652 RepID=UPI00102C8252|nr:phosphate ABC transporter substrate-binding protein PstS [Motilibacter rhizosphaerae]